MKVPKLFYLLFFSSISMSSAQENLEQLLVAGIADTQRFAEHYFEPASKGLTYSITSGWFNNAKSLRKFGFEISIIGNIGFVEDKNTRFNMVVSDYENIRFQDNSPNKSVATVFGASSGESVILTYDNPVFGNQEVSISLPGGIGTLESSLVPTAFLQAGFSPLKGTQIKVRVAPKLSYNDANLNAYGFALQQNLIAWLPANKVLPVAISGLIAYTHLDGFYDFSASGIVNGQNQQISTNVNTMLYQLVVGTKLKIINFYGSLGYVSAKTNMELLGTYKIVSGNLSSDDIINPISVKNKISGIRTTFGASLKLGIFGFNADYAIAEYNSASFGLNFGF